MLRHRRARSSGRHHEFGRRMDHEAPDGQSLRHPRHQLRRIPRLLRGRARHPAQHSRWRQHVDAARPGHNQRAGRDQLPIHHHVLRGRMARGHLRHHRRRRQLDPRVKSWLRVRQHAPRCELRHDDGLRGGGAAVAPARCQPARAHCASRRSTCPTATLQRASGTHTNCDGWTA